MTAMLSNIASVLITSPQLGSIRRRLLLSNKRQLLSSGPCSHRHFCSCYCCHQQQRTLVDEQILFSKIFTHCRASNQTLYHRLQQQKHISSISIKHSSRSSGDSKQQFEVPKNCLRQPFATSTNNHYTNMSTSKIISGKEVAEEIRLKLLNRVAELNIKPKLVIVQVGCRQDSNVYIRMKIKFAESIGASAELVQLSRDISELEVTQKILELNNDKTVHGIITQLPFDCSLNIDSDKIVNLIDPKKDVDGLSVYNAGKLSHGELNSSSFIPCTPNGCIELIKKSGIKIEGTHSVVIGRSKIVGSPMAQLLVWHNSTVTICHSKTKNLDEICRQADILVAAVGRAQMVKKSWLKPGAVVIDCGINVIPDATKASGTRLVGDVDFDDCKQVASAITPVPGGVGPMTVAMLIANTVESASRLTSASIRDHKLRT